MATMLRYCFWVCVCLCLCVFETQNFTCVCYEIFLVFSNVNLFTIFFLFYMQFFFPHNHHLLLRSPSLIMQPQASCTSCPVGQFMPLPGNQTTCFQCPSGRFQLQSGSLDCVNCAPGSYSSGLGAAQCLACPPGSYQNASNATAWYVIFIRHHLHHHHHHHHQGRARF
jgi:hypothetical protein